MAANATDKNSSLVTNSINFFIHSECLNGSTYLRTAVRLFFGVINPALMRMTRTFCWVQPTC